MLVGRIAYNRRVPQGPFREKMVWASKEIPMAHGSGILSYLKFGFNVDSDPEVGYAESERRILALEPYVTTTAELSDWLVEAGRFFKYEQLVALEKRHKARIDTELKLLLLMQKCNVEMGLPGSPQARQRLETELFAILNQDFSGASKSNILMAPLGHFLFWSQSRAELLADYHRLVALAPKDRHWKEQVDQALQNSVPPELYGPALTGLILQELKKSPNLPIRGTPTNP